MKTYKQFVIETRQFDEGFWQAVGKGVSYMTGGKVNSATKVANAVLGAHAVRRGIESGMKGDEFGIYNAAAQAIPLGGGPAFNAIKLGAIGLDQMRLKQRDDERKKKEEKAKSEILRK